MNTDIFLSQIDCSQNQLTDTVNTALNNTQDGELFVEISNSESFALEDSTIRSVSYDSSAGFGLRGIVGEQVAFAESSALNLASIKQAGNTINAIRNNAAKVSLPPVGKPNQLYHGNNPLEGTPFNVKTKLLADIDKYLRDKEPRIKQVSTSLSGEWQAVMIVRQGGYIATDIRPLVRLNIAVVVEENGRMETGSYGAGGRDLYDSFITPKAWQHQANEALRQALVNLTAIEAPAAEVPVVLGSGWPAVLLHEAVGHGLEGDFHRKQTSVFTELMGKRVASKGVTVIDDGTIADRRGSINIDDEGTPSAKNVLIEDGILVGLMQDRLNARLMGVKPTGNGRRESYSHTPMPRMTNTYMLNGNAVPDDIISSVKDGIYAPNFGGGQVDIVSGKFVFSASEAYKIEGGKVTQPIKGATLIGNGMDIMNKISMIGNDMRLDTGIGTCGKDGQGVPVGVGQPTLLVDSMTVGGTQV